MKGLKYVGTLSSNGIQTTTSANYVIEFDLDKCVSDLTIYAEGNAISVKFNDEVTPHLIQADYIYNINEIQIKKFTIVQSGVKYSYDAMYF